MNIVKFFKTRKVDLKKETFNVFHQLEEIKKNKNKVKALVDYIELRETKIKELRNLSLKLVGKKEKMLSQIIREISVYSDYRPKMRGSLSEKIFLGDIYGIWTKSCHWILQNEENLQEKHPDVFFTGTTDPVRIWDIFQIQAENILQKISTEGLEKVQKN